MEKGDKGQMERMAARKAGPGHMHGAVVPEGLAVRGRLGPSGQPGLQKHQLRSGQRGRCKRAFVHHTGREGSGVRPA